MIVTCLDDFVTKYNTGHLKRRFEESRNDTITFPDENDAVLTWPLLVPQSPEPGLLEASNHTEKVAHFNLLLAPCLGQENYDPVQKLFHIFLADSLTFLAGQ